MIGRPGQPPMLNLPAAGKFAALAERVFASGRLTNNGEMARELEARLADHLDVPYVVLTSSGTLALQVAYRALGLTGEVITTPFSWTTTVSSMAWIGLRPRFADIDARTYNIDPAQVEAEITPATRAIVAVHTFGNPCDIESIERIAGRHRLRTIYDAAHAFGVRYQDRSVFSYGDASVLSLHATKLFHTVEGGVVILRDRAAWARARLIVNNGIDPQGRVQALGINGRLSELHAAVGLCLFDDIEPVLRRRRRLATMLRMLLAETSSVQLQAPTPFGQVNHAYFPVVFPSREVCEHASRALARDGFAARRYFDMPLNRLPFIAEGPPMPIAESLTRRVLCLPLRAAADVDEIQTIAGIVAAACPAHTRPLFLQPA